MDKSKLKDITRNFRDLPTLPGIALQISDMMNNPNVSASDLAKLISADQSLTMRILKVANSAYYGFPRKIGTITLAVVVLGFDALKSLTLSMTILDHLKKWGGADGFDFNEFWRHSIYTAIIARFLSRQTGYKVAGEAFVTGLIHDVGKLVISQKFPEQFAEILETASGNGRKVYEIENEILGADHAELGSWLVDNWNLPGYMSEAVAYHHHPEKAAIEIKLSALVNTANRFALDFGAEKWAETYKDDFNPYAWNVLKMRNSTNGGPDEKYYRSMIEHELEKADSFVQVLNTEGEAVR
ncbi:HDOD domain-containing protein [bacterium]|nr:HDOD domain-containing protein [FCB group bacterium]MBL7192217.1 HDOD domain-containing protein [bacterium]